MLLTMKAEYALMLLIHLAGKKQESGPFPARSIAENLDIPHNIVAQIAAQLSRCNWIEGKRGAGGGLILSKDPEKISVLDVVCEIEDSFTIKRCLAEDCSRRESCQLYHLWSEAQRRVEEFFSEITIADLAEGKR